MAAAMGNNFLQLGATVSGNRALGDTQMAWALMPLNSLARWICEIENNGCGGLPGTIQELTDRNWPGVKNYPKLKCERVNPFEHRETIPVLMEALSSEIIPSDPRVRLPLASEIEERQRRLLEQRPDLGLRQGHDLGADPGGALPARDLERPGQHPRAVRMQDEVAASDPDRAHRADVLKEPAR